MRFRGALWAVPFVTMLAASSAFCQTVRVTLTGSVTDAEGRTLQGAQITVDPGDEGAVSDAKGLFTLRALPSGEYTVTMCPRSSPSTSVMRTSASGWPRSLIVCHRPSGAGACAAAPSAARLKARARRMRPLP